MTPKEKAKELVEKYQFNGDMIDDIRMIEESAIECALICIDELIELYEFEVPHRGFKISYWDEVKQGIEKL